MTKDLDLIGFVTSYFCWIWKQVFYYPPLPFFWNVLSKPNLKIFASGSTHGPAHSGPTHSSLQIQKGDLCGSRSRVSSTTWSRVTQRSGDIQPCATSGSTKRTGPWATIENSDVLYVLDFLFSFQGAWYLFLSRDGSGRTSITRSKPMIRFCHKMIPTRLRENWNWITNELCTSTAVKNLDYQDRLRSSLRMKHLIQTTYWWIWMPDLSQNAQKNNYGNLNYF